jgi:hypothetical protein
VEFLQVLLKNFRWVGVINPKQLYIGTAGSLDHKFIYLVHTLGTEIFSMSNEQLASKVASIYPISNLRALPSSLQTSSMLGRFHPSSIWAHAMAISATFHTAESL